MKISRMIAAIDTHTSGEAARLIIGGITKFPGKTMAEKKAYLEKKSDHLRKILMYEPRGHKDMFGAFITEPVNEEADYGIIFMDAGGYLNMCGHNTIAAMTTAVEQGWVKVAKDDREVTVVQDTPAGVVHGKVQLDGEQSVISVSFENVPAFLYKKDIEVNVPGIGKLIVDISFGGSFFVLLPAKSVDLNIEPKNSEKFSKIGLKIRNAVNEQIEIQHPTLKHINQVDLVEFYGSAVSSDANYQNVVVFGDGQVDRSPCGTGTCAKLATLYGKGQMNIGESFIYESILQTKFKGQIIKETMVDNYKAIIPCITGSAYITGFNTFLVNPKDPLKDGFILG
ncbi:proline racemase family protein [Melissococcus plutonius]|uniref:Proline racemase n=1 Tax=Melissococcus plutonius (strain ATCC 35311 / DSM 29964 / CIP 104052 / LMG 20360 / NCIMB 702443) TaxID=940190 RepID=F3Y8B3_MELPT|nr:proline racemase family protein [Melissococcus plutonius]KMT30716.1 proline racemase [Melissococcus plutonius]KMT35341.1 proline racemase [Melissococcus plutonius]KMT41079.1 proline racemase [Melissococcus plutonius]MBB5177908.1 proline racemase/trans-L-3-hydroxyproline dehydratase [Melissococcus plutonius]BAK20741.1 proline racemase [Melissococcus plutonius ATCC 35311]